MNCPFCGSKNVDAEFVDIGVGMEQVSAYGCQDCGARQMNPYYDDDNCGDAEERKCRWWRGREAEKL